MKSEDTGEVSLGQLLQLSKIKKRHIAHEMGIPASRLSEFLCASRPLSETNLENLRETLIAQDVWTRRQIDSAIKSSSSYFEESKI